MTEVENIVEFEKPTADYLRVATASPETSLANVRANVTSLTEAYEDARQQQAELVVTPELSMTGYSTADFFHNQHVLKRTTEGLEELATITADGPAMLVGAPLEHNDVLYNCAVMLAEGRIQGVVPKVHLPNAREFYERRWFTSGEGVAGQHIQIGDQEVPFGTDILWDINGTRVAAEICEDMFAPISPGTYAALAGAKVVANLSASNEILGKAEYRKLLISSFTGKTACAYVYSSAGRGESVADVIYGGHQLIAENGHISAEREPLSDNDQPLVFDIDRTYLEHDRFENKTFADQAKAFQLGHSYRTVKIAVPTPEGDDLKRFIDPEPFVPTTPETLNKRCEELFSYTSHALAQRIQEKNTQALDLGLSGGLDSTLAVLIALEAVKQLDKPASFIHTITMPAQASSERTQNNASRLAEELGTTHKEIPVQDLSSQLLTAIGHDEEEQDLTYENVQARMRTNILMNYANFIHGMTQGTGDMSELANSFCTFNGDHMSMFNPNAGIPKSLVRHLIGWHADNHASEAVHDILHDILDTPVSPELTGDGDLSQTTEDIVGPYDLADFFLFELNRRGSAPDKIGYLAVQAFAETYDQPTVAKWMETFIDRYINGQWKRDVATNATQVGTVSLSPRGALRLAPNISLGWRN